MIFSQRRESKLHFFNKVAGRSPPSPQFFDERDSTLYASSCNLDVINRRHFALIFNLNVVI